MADRVRQILLARILEGTYPAGYRLVELQIATELNTSQGPVREALRELEAMQLVLTEPYRGTRVRNVTEREMREAYDVRCVLEQFAATLAAPRLQGNVRDLEARVRAIRAAAEACDSEGYASNDVPFHHRIVAASGNAILLRTWESLHFETRLHLLLARGKIDLIAAQWLHGPIVEALGRGDGETAGELLGEHARSFFQQVETAFNASSHTPRS